jgi:biopolymer transport protein ExbB
MISLEKILTELHAIGSGGGWLFWALILLAFAIAYALMGLWNALRFPEATLLTPREWTRLLRQPNGTPEIFARLSDELSRATDPGRTLQEIGQRLFSRPGRRFPFAFVMISAAPLLGLLGTVSGMFTTFDGMAANVAEKPIDVISKGIFEALITTETGLVIGVPTFIVCAWLKARHDALVLHFHQIESRLLGELGKRSA